MGSDAARACWSKTRGGSPSWRGASPPWPRPTTGCGRACRSSGSPDFSSPMPFRPPRWFLSGAARHRCGAVRLRCRREPGRQRGDGGTGFDSSGISARGTRSNRWPTGRALGWPSWPSDRSPGCVRSPRSRGAILLVTGPLNLLFVGAGFVAVPEGVRLFKQSPGRLPHATRLFSRGGHRLDGRLVCGRHRGIRSGRAAAPRVDLATGEATAADFHCAGAGLGRVHRTGPGAVGPRCGSPKPPHSTGERRPHARRAAALAPRSTAHAARPSARGRTVITTGIWWWQFRRAFAEASTMRLDAQPSPATGFSEATAGATVREEDLRGRRGGPDPAAVRRPGHGHRVVRPRHVRAPAGLPRPDGVLGRRWPRSASSALGKLLHLAGLVPRILWCRFRTGAKVLYYPPAGPDLVPVLRDLVVLLCTRWAFRADGLPLPRRRAVGDLSAAARGRCGRCSVPPTATPISPSSRRTSIRRTASSCDARPIRDRPRRRARPPRRATRAGPDRAATPVILYVGVLRESKGLLVLVDACRAACASAASTFGCI